MFGLMKYRNNVGFGFESVEQKLHLQLRTVVCLNLWKISLNFVGCSLRNHELIQKCCDVASECAVLEAPLFWSHRALANKSRVWQFGSHFQIIWIHGFSNEIFLVYSVIFCLKFELVCHILVCMRDKILGAEPKRRPNHQWMTSESALYSTLGCDIQGFRFQDFPANWLTVPREANRAHLGSATGQ